jgi:hypothetical protein
MAKRFYEVLEFQSTSEDKEVKEDLSQDGD